MQDKEITCKCGQKFVHTVEDQKFYEEMKFEEPKRCKPCRDKKKRDRATAGKDN